MSPLVTFSRICIPAYELSLPLCFCLSVGSCPSALQPCTSFAARSPRFYTHLRRRHFFVVRPQVCLRRGRKVPQLCLNDLRGQSYPHPIVGRVGCGARSWGRQEVERARTQWRQRRRWRQRVSSSSSSSGVRKGRGRSSGGSSKSRASKGDESTGGARFGGVSVGPVQDGQVWGRQAGGRAGRERGGIKGHGAQPSHRCRTCVG